MTDDSGAGQEAPLTPTERMLRDNLVCLQRIAQYLGEQEYRRVLGTISNPNRLEHWGRKVYSQSDEDGILAEILRRVGITPAAGVLIEFGVENGLQSNTHWLLRQGYRTVWLEYSDRHVKWIRRFFADYLGDGRLELAHELVTRDTVDARLTALAAGRPVSVLSIDVDGNDYWLWERVAAIHPAVVVVEYNATSPPPISIVQEYEDEGPRKVKTDYWGASLSAFHKLARRKGYQLVGCGVVGVNAFFVRDELVTQERFPYSWTPEALYHPLRRKLITDAFVPGFPAAVGRYEEI